MNPYTLCPVGEHNPRAPRRWLFPTPKGVARACQRNLSLYDEALEDRGRYRPKPSLPSALGSRLDPDGEGGQLISQMAMAPGAGLISIVPTGASAPSSLIAAAGYVLTRPAYPWRKRENRKSGATKNRTIKAWSPGWRSCRPLNTAASAITPKALAGLLKPFVTLGDGKELRGYPRHALENAFSCYLPPLQCVDVSETPQLQAQVASFQCVGEPSCRHIEKAREMAGAVARPAHRHVEAAQGTGKEN